MLCVRRLPNGQNHQRLGSVVVQDMFRVLAPGSCDPLYQNAASVVNLLLFLPPAVNGGLPGGDGG